MSVIQLQPGDTVYAAKDIYNDGSLPGYADDAPLAPKNTRGVIVNTGHLEESPETVLFLVRFEDADLSLGPAIGCWLQDLSVAPESDG